MDFLKESFGLEQQHFINKRNEKIKELTFAKFIEYNRDSLVVLFGQDVV